MFRLVSFGMLVIAASPTLAASRADTQTPTVAAPAAAPVTPPRRGQVLHDAAGARLGVIDSVSSDGNIGLIVDGRYVRLPASVVTNLDGSAKTSLTKKDVKAIH